LIALVAIGSVFDASFDRIMGPRMDNYRSKLVNLRHAQMVLSDTQEGLLGYAISGRPERLEQFLSGKKMVAEQKPAGIRMYVNSATQTISGPAGITFR
jgi:hypothetical protein